jgi:hypothetical protein
VLEENKGNSSAIERRDVLSLEALLASGLGRRIPRRMEGIEPGGWRKRFARLRKPERTNACDAIEAVTEGVESNPQLLWDGTKGVT